MMAQATAPHMLGNRAAVLSAVVAYEAKQPRKVFLLHPSVSWGTRERSLKVPKKTGKGFSRSYSCKLHHISRALPRWWERNGEPNMVDIHSSEELFEALMNADNKLVVVEFYATWCTACRALHPEICNLAKQHKEVEFLIVNATEKDEICKTFNVKVFPLFQFYRGSQGLLQSFSCTLSKLQKLRNAIAKHSTDRCSI